MNTPNRRRADRDDVPNETLARRADLGTLHRMLTERQARKADAVVPAAAIESRRGVLHVAGAIEPALSDRGVTVAGAAALRPTRSADGQIAELAGIPGGARIAAAALKTSKPGDQLPWQRVIGKAGKLRGRIAIHDPVGAAIQRELLGAEGVEIGDTGLVALDDYDVPAHEVLRSSPAYFSCTRRFTRQGPRLFLFQS